MNEETAKELALISSYIVWADLLNGTIFQTFDIAYEIAEEFIKEYPVNTKWALNKQWDETLERFVKQRYINGKKIL